ncbi:hypothetical protein TWF970_008070 [Orbilia oligospora]|uniref:Uncharacterized protein n=1 Tax=Orbilia oligospora TaxID=2813651 RepID=A0A7C8VA32_ORBOL|nr:hypothetical protein TWF970_008070 [Orbilia oligospora]
MSTDRKSALGGGIFGTPPRHKAPSTPLSLRERGRTQSDAKSPTSSKNSEIYCDESNGDEWLFRYAANLEVLQLVKDIEQTGRKALEIELHIQKIDASLRKIGKPRTSTLEHKLFVTDVEVKARRITDEALHGRYGKEIFTECENLKLRQHARALKRNFPKPLLSTETTGHSHLFSIRGTMRREMEANTIEPGGLFPFLWKTTKFFNGLNTLKQALVVMSSQA